MAKQKTTTRGWMTLLACFVVTFFQLGSMKAFGVFVPEFSTHLSMSMWEIGVTGGLWIGLRCLFGPLWSALTRVFSYRALTILGGTVSTMGILSASVSVSATQLNCSMAIMGIGHGLPLVAKVVALRDYFEPNFSMANGVAFAGGALGMIIFAPLMEWLIRIYGWRGALMIYGAFNLHICVAGSVMIKPAWAITANAENISENDKGKNEAKEKGGVCRLLTTLVNHLGLYLLGESPVTAVYLTAFGLHATAITGWMVFLVSYTISVGYSHQTASFLSSIGGCGALIGRLLFGPIVDKGLLSGRTMFCLLAAGGALSLMSYPLTDLYWLLSIISFSTGLFLGATTPVFIVVLHELFPEDSYAFTGAVGLHYMTRGIGRMVGGPLTGWLYDWTGEFYTAFLTLAALEATTALLMILPYNYDPN